jgi:hypothetical protein
LTSKHFFNEKNDYRRYISEIKIGHKMTDDLKWLNYIKKFKFYVLVLEDREHKELSRTSFYSTLRAAGGEVHILNEGDPFYDTTYSYPTFSGGDISSIIVLTDPEATVLDIFTNVDIAKSGWEKIFEKHKDMVTL